MEQTAEKIIQRIGQQTNLPRKDILKRIAQLSRSLKYNIEDDDPTIPKLLTQELNVGLDGNPTDYLYIELLYDKWPLFARIIPLTTIYRRKSQKYSGK